MSELVNCSSDKSVSPKIKLTTNTTSTILIISSKLVGRYFSIHIDLFIIYNDNLLIKKSPHPKLYDAAILLDKNLTSISPILSSFGGNYSIIKINKYIPPALQEYSKVYSRIEALLLKNKKEHIIELYNPDCGNSLPKNGWIQQCKNCDIRTSQVLEFKRVETRKTIYVL